MSSESNEKSCGTYIDMHEKFSRKTVVPFHILLSFNLANCKCEIKGRIELIF